MDQPSDGRLLAAWSRGETGAFEALVARHERALLRHARALLGDWKAGEDVVQEAFLRLAQRPPTVDADVIDDARASAALLSSWLHQVTRNLCMDTQRSEKRRRRREEEAASHEAVSGGIDVVETADTKAAVERGLLRLPQDQREVLVLRLFDEKSYAEIAEITGKKTGTVGWLISVGLKALADELATLTGGARVSGAAAGGVAETNVDVGLSVQSGGVA
jgi:RNA polymerase sigma-70 factor (ECF subfamily)